jgi:hypothetical protein
MPAWNKKREKDIFSCWKLENTSAMVRYNAASGITHHEKLVLPVTLSDSEELRNRIEGG